MNSRLRLRLVAIAASLIVTDCLLVCLVAADHWIYVGLFGITIVYTVRLLGVLVSVSLSTRSVTLLLLAPLLPYHEAMNWLPELDGQLREVAAEPARWHAIRSDIVRNMPRLVYTTWTTRARTRLVAVAARYAEPRLVAIDRVQRSSRPPWPTNTNDTQIRRKQLHTLQRCARLLLWYADQPNEPNLAWHARRLVSSCTLARRHMNKSAHLQPPSSPAYELLLEINHTTMLLANATATHRRSQK